MTKNRKRRPAPRRIGAISNQNTPRTGRTSPTPQKNVHFVDEDGTRLSRPAEKTNLVELYAELDLLAKQCRESSSLLRDARSDADNANLHLESARHFWADTANKIFNTVYTLLEEVQDTSKLIEDELRRSNTYLKSLSKSLRASEEQASDMGLTASIISSSLARLDPEQVRQQWA